MGLILYKVYIVRDLPACSSLKFPAVSISKHDFGNVKTQLTPVIQNLRTHSSRQDSMVLQQVYKFAGNNPVPIAPI